MLSLLLVLAVTINATAPVIAERSGRVGQSPKVPSLKQKNLKNCQTKKNCSQRECRYRIGQKSGETVDVFYAIGKGGYGGDIEFILVWTRGTITGYQVMKSSEPWPRLSCAEDPFVSSVVGKKQIPVVLSTIYGDYEIQAISSTVSVNAILNGINGAVAAIQECHSRRSAMKRKSLKDGIAKTIPYSSPSSEPVQHWHFLGY